MTGTKSSLTGASACCPRVLAREDEDGREPCGAAEFGCFGNFDNWDLRSRRRLFAGCFVLAYAGLSASDFQNSPFRARVGQPIFMDISVRAQPNRAASLGLGARMRRGTSLIVHLSFHQQHVGKCVARARGGVARIRDLDLPLFAPCASVETIQGSVHGTHRRSGFRPKRCAP